MLIIGVRCNVADEKKKLFELPKVPTVINFAMQMMTMTTTTIESFFLLVKNWKIQIRVDDIDRSY